MLACALLAFAGLAGSAAGAFPGGEGRIVFESNVGGQFDVYTIDGDGTDRVNLTNHPGADRDAQWSPDGRWLAFSSNRDGDWDIWVMGADGSGLHNLTDDAGAKRDTDPSWSPDGSRIAFVSDRSAHASDLGESSDEIWAMGADGSFPVRLTVNRTLDDDPAFSPDGSTIAWALFSGQAGFDIWRMGVDGSGRVRLTQANGDDERPTWSPGGALVVFSSQRAGGSGFKGGGVGSLYSVHIDGSGQEALTHAGVDRDPAFSPTGEALVFSSQRAGGSRLFVIGRDGVVVQISDQLAMELEPDWQPSPPALPGLTPPIGPEGCTIRGTILDDIIAGTRGDDVICGLGGNDAIRGLAGDDVLIGGNGDDQLLGGAGNDRLVGGRGVDRGTGGRGLDSCDVETAGAC